MAFHGADLEDGYAGSNAKLVVTMLSALSDRQYEYLPNDYTPSPFMRSDEYLFYNGLDDDESML